MNPVQLRLDTVMRKKRQRNKCELSNSRSKCVQGGVMAPVILTLLSRPFKKETPD